MDAPRLAPRASRRAFFLLLAFGMVPGVQASPSAVGIADGSVVQPASGTAPLSFALSRSGASNYAVVVPYSTVDDSAVAGSDYTATSGSATIAAGSTGTTVSVAALASGSANDEQFFLNLAGATGIGAAPGFGAAVSSSVGTEPRAVATADFNGDGRPDLVIANTGSNSVSVRLNTTAPGAGAASYAAPVSFAVGTEPRSVTVVDFNGDGRPDLAVANNGSDNVSVLRNTSAPGAAAPAFAARVNFAVGSNPLSIAVSDFNGDGRPDLVTANDGGGVSVLRNSGRAGAALPGYGPAVNIPVIGAPKALAVADVNGDGRSDLVVAGYTLLDSGYVAVLLNTAAPGDKTPSYKDPASFPVGDCPASVITADFNRDGRPDLAVDNECNGGVAVLLNTGAAGAVTANYAAAVNFPVASSSNRSLAVADYNGDSKPDLAVGSFNGVLSVLRNTSAAGASKPAFSTAVNFPAGSDSAAVAVADVNGDGRPDLVAANAGSNSVSTVLNTTAAPTAALSYAAARTSAVGVLPRGIATGDFNGDGRRDVAVVSNNNGTVSVLLNTSPAGALKASYAAAVNFAVGAGPFDVAAADINGDGRLDLAVANQDSNTVSVLLNTTVAGAATPSYSAAVAFAVSTRPGSIAVADFNGDGRPDLVTANNDGDPDSVSNSLSLLRNTTATGASAPAYAAAVNLAEGLPLSVTVADFNGDGRMDLATASVIDGVSLRLNDTVAGSATLSFSAPITIPGDDTPGEIAVADFNGDGRPDLAVPKQTGNAVAVQFNTSAAGAAPTFSAAKDFAVGGTPYSIVAADLNGDGRPDLAVANFSGNSVSVLRNTAVTGAPVPSYAAAVNVVMGTFPDSLTAADIDGDGRSDLLVSNVDDGTVTTRLNSQYQSTISDTFAVGTIRARDTTPNPFGFTAVTNVPKSTVQTSNTVTITGINVPAPVSVANGTYSIGCTAAGFTSAAGMIAEGQTVCVRHTSSAGSQQKKNTKLTVGGVSATFSSTTSF